MDLMILVVIGRCFSVMWYRVVLSLSLATLVPSVELVGYSAQIVNLYKGVLAISIDRILEACGI